MSRALCVLAFIASVACQHTSGPKRPVIGVSLLTETHTFFKELERGLRDEAAARGLDVVVVACEMDPAKQAAQIEDFVAQRVAAILLAP
jgi:ribose transport system substrate-binding protein